jgi:hypothetical protein
MTLHNRLRRSGNVGALTGGCRAMIGLWGLPRDRTPWPTRPHVRVPVGWSPVSGCSRGSGRRRG